MYVVAADWAHALAVWRTQIAEENGVPLDEKDDEQPTGISLVCEEGDLLLPRFFYEEDHD